MCQTTSLFEYQPRKRRSKNGEDMTEYQYYTVMLSTSSRTQPKKGDRKKEVRM